MMSFEDFAQKNGFSEKFLKELEPFRQKLWDNSSDEAPSFMEKEFYTRYYPLCGGTDPAEIYPMMDEVCRIVHSEPAAARYASMIHYAFCRANPIIRLPWEPPVSIFGLHAGIFQLMVWLSSFPLIQAKHQELNLPEKYFHEICKNIGGDMEFYAATHDGVPGCSLAATHWARYYIDGTVFRIGRLQYLPRQWGNHFPAIYRNRTDHSLAVLCLDGWAFDRNGFRIDHLIEKPEFTARLKIYNGKLTGTPINPDGKPVPGRELTLDLSEWEPLCAPWDPIMTIHIPSGGGLTVEAVRSSLIEAVKFYHDYLKLDVKLFTCSSWILNPAWEKELPGSNLAAFQRNGYMTPTKPPGGNPGLRFVYGDDDCDPRTRPRTTALHHAFCRILDRGEPLRQGVMILPASEVEYFGTEYYRKKYNFGRQSQSRPLAEQEE